MGKCLAALGLALALAGCGSSGITTGCVPGEQRACPCPGGVMRVQVWNADGLGFAACVGCPTIDPNADLSVDPNSDLSVDPNADLSANPPPDLSANPPPDLSANPTDLTGNPPDLTAPIVDMRVNDLTPPADM